MAHNVNVWTTEWKKTGANISFPQYSMKVRMQWRDNAGTAHNETRTVLFPDILLTIAGQGTTAREWVENELAEMILKAGRKILAVDE